MILFLIDYLFKGLFVSFLIYSIIIYFLNVKAKLKLNKKRGSTEVSAKIIQSDIKIKIVDTGGEDDTDYVIKLKNNVVFLFDFLGKQNKVKYSYNFSSGGFGSCKPTKCQIDNFVNRVQKKNGTTQTIYVNKKLKIDDKKLLDNNSNLYITNKERNIILILTIVFMLISIIINY